MEDSEHWTFVGSCGEGIVTRRALLRAALAGSVVAAGQAVLPRRAAAATERSAVQPVFANDLAGSLVPAAIGGPMLADGQSISLRWLGCSCYELVHRGKVYLLDAWYDRGPRTRPIGFGPDDVVQAEAIFIGHAHFDHIADAPPIAARTGAGIMGAPISTGYAASADTPVSQLMTVTGRGGEIFEFDGFTVEPILAHHAVGPTRTNSKGETVGQAIVGVYEAALDPYTPAEADALEAMLSRGSFDPLIYTEGTIAYLFTFESGYRLVWLDSGGPITPELQATMDRIGQTNLAIASYTVQGVPELQVPVTMALANLFQPDVFIPCHHDQILGLAATPQVPGGLALPDMATEPLRLAMRDAMPSTQVLAPLYRDPIVVDTATGAVSAA